jgi:putative ABC transport system permease protein
MHNKAFESLTATNGWTVTLTGRDEPEHLYAMNCSANLFSTLGVQPILGRSFSPEEGAGANQVTVISHSLWERKFGADPKIIGQALTLNNSPYTVVGVMPPNFRFPADRRVELWVPRTFQGSGKFLGVVGRLKPGITLEQAKADIDPITRSPEGQLPTTNSLLGVRVITLHEGLVLRVKPALLVLWGAVTFVLLIACVNLFNLLSAQATVRYKEIAIRSALGAGRLRIIRQLLTESILLSLLGGGAGLLLAFASLDLLISISAVSIPRLELIEIDGSVLVFTLFISLLTGIVTGLIPALQCSKPDLQTTIKESGVDLIKAPHRLRLRNLLVISEVALSLILLAGAGLMIKSLWRLSHVDPGLNPENVLTASIDLPSSRYRTPDPVASFCRQLLGRVRKLPGVTHSGIGVSIPLSGGGIVRPFKIDDRASGASD